ncbi:MAG: inositol monophosphatase [Oscillospiraceae bacterium]|nr:inositol monophosphatase [Oscillospiraceae bacterium]
MLEQIAAIVKEAGEIVLSAHDIAAHTHEKSSAADLVTEYDLAVENFLKEKLPPLVPGAIFYGEEEQENADPATGWAFIVDPIDGTTNFVRGLRQSAVSVALAKDGVIEYGVVLDPYKAELFSARRGGGAFLNGSLIHVSDRPLSQGVFGMGTAIYRREYLAPTMRLTEQLFRRSCDFRRMGAAALDLCNVACGRTELFFEYSLCPWDYAAGSLLVTEAGGVISTLDGQPLAFDRRCSCWASNQVNRDILRELDIR